MGAHPRPLGFESFLGATHSRAATGHLPIAYLGGGAMMGGQRERDGLPEKCYFPVPTFVSLGAPLPF